MAVARSAGPTAVSGSDLRAEDIVTADVLVSGKRVIILTADEQGLVVGGVSTKAHRVIITGKDGVSYQGRMFRGRLEALWQKPGGRAQVLLVHPLPMESYLVGIVSGELPKDWPLEAMKAQAVAARTYALYQKFHAPDRPYHMESSVLDQVYGGIQRESAAARSAVMATAGEVLTYRRRPIRAYFHSCCGGRTESAADGWGTPLDYLPSVECGFCGDCPRLTWTLRYGLEKLGADLRERKLGVGSIKEAGVSRTTPTGRAAELKVIGTQKTQTLHPEDLRRLLGYDNLRSRAFSIKRDGSELVFTGRGSGHAVGMCQWGARGMALSGYSYRGILERYYPGNRLLRMY